MTTPQSGRDAFEALSPTSVRNFIDALNGQRGELDAWLECNNEAEVRAHIKAALAQQGPEVGEEVELREALKVAEAALADIGDADREPGDDIAWAERRAAVALPQVRAALLATPKQKSVEVTEEMVDLALAAYNSSRGTYSDEVPADRDDIRSALLAALPGKTEVDRG